MQYFVFRYVLDLHSATAQVFLCLCSCLRLSSDRSLSRTHCEKFDFLAAKSQDVGSRVMSFCLIFTRKLAFHIYISQKSPWAIPRKLVVWLLCHGGGGDKELGGGHSLREPPGLASLAKISRGAVKQCNLYTEFAWGSHGNSKNR